MIYADPLTGNASESAVAPAGYTLTFSSAALYEVWRDENFGFVEPEQPAPIVPSEVTNQQLRLALIEYGIFPSVILAQLNAMPDGAPKEKALAAWEYANYFRRDHPLVETLAAQIGLSSAQVDSLFILANTLG